MKIETNTLSSLMILPPASGAVCKNIAGITKAIATNNNEELAANAPVLLNFCFLYFQPPANIAIPATNKRFPIIEPVIEALTTSTNPALIAKIPIKSSVALPKVALSSPPSAGPTYTAISSVASPIYFANGTIAKAARKKIIKGEI